jgi:hypothetical protein
MRGGPSKNPRRRSRQLIVLILQSIGALTRSIELPNIRTIAAGGARSIGTVANGLGRVTTDRRE